jgi:transposase-like protein
LKLTIIDQIANGQISVNHASNKYNISRSSIQYWMKKLTNFENKSNTMSKNDEIKKLKERIEELEFVKDFQQDVIADFENITGEHLSKKYLPEALAKEIEIKRKKLTK